MKNAKFYGISSRLYMTGWQRELYIFDTMEQAQDWLNSYKYHTGEKPLSIIEELTTREKAIEIVGIKEVEYCEQFANFEIN